MPAANPLALFREQIDLIDQALFCFISYQRNYLPKMLTSKMLANDRFDALPAGELSCIPKVFWDLIVKLLPLVAAVVFRDLHSSDRKTYTRGQNPLSYADKAWQTGLISLLHLRFKLSFDIGSYKQAEKIKTIDAKRWAKVKKLKIQQSAHHKLPAEEMLIFWDKVHELSCHVQENLKEYQIV